MLGKRCPKAQTSKAAKKLVLLDSHDDTMLEEAVEAAVFLQESS
ncbi:hypothetical protein [Nostoc edaphicum]|nr:hypothetical protein [Nostoc edaphicum]